MTETRLLILGARIFGEEVADLASDVPGLHVDGFVENLDRDHPVQLNGLPIHWIDDIGRFATTHRVLCALTTTRRRGFVQQAATLGMQFTTLVHPAARVSRTTSIGAGSIVSAGCIVASHTTIGAHVVLNRGVLIGHHTVIDDYATVQPGCNIAGLCRIGEAAYLGMGATVIDRISVGAGTVIGAAALVTRDVPASVLAVGAPARISRRGIEPK